MRDKINLRGLNKEIEALLEVAKKYKKTDDWTVTVNFWLDDERQIELHHLTKKGNEIRFTLVGGVCVREVHTKSFRTLRVIKPQ